MTSLPFVRVKTTLFSFYYDIHHSVARTSSSLKLLDLNQVTPFKLYPLWLACPFDSTSVLGTAVLMKVLLGVFPFQSRIAKFNPNLPDTCKLCHAAPEDLIHFLFHCPALSLYFAKFSALFSHLFPSNVTLSIDHILYPLNFFTHDTKLREQFRYTVVRYVFYIYSKRRKLLRLSG